MQQVDQAGLGSNESRGLRITSERKCCARKTRHRLLPASRSLLQWLYLAPVLLLLAGGQSTEQARDDNVDYVNLIGRSR